FKKQFIHTREIDWLINPLTGYHLELDCYNEELAVALEYQGITHYKWPNYLQNKPNTRYAFEKAINRDKIKRQLCKDNNVFLIEIPFTIKNDDIPTYIFNVLDYNNYKIYCK